MSTFEVKIETITVFPHPNADRLELARVGLYNIVVGKDTWKTGDKVLYIPEYAVLPEYLITALNLEGKLAGTNADRVKPVKLRGELSQGLVAPLNLLPDGALESIGQDGDFAEVLGITKWQPAIPTSMSGDVEGNYGLISWVDVENIKKFPDLFEDGEEVIVDEKIHGTASLYTFINPTGENPEVLVSSKGLGEKKLVLKSSDRVLYWRVINEYNLTRLAELVSNTLDGDVTKVGIFGETFGGSVQDLDYGYNKGALGFRVFDIYVETVTPEAGTVGRWLNPDEVENFATIADIPLVPRLYVGPFSIDKIAELATGKEQVSGRELHIREGVVVRPANRGIGYETGAHRIAKYVSDAYLTRKGKDGKEPTEYQ